MLIYILRHGEAQFDAPSDAVRPLTEFGILQAQRVGAFLKQQQIAFDLAFVSPYLRAQQTYQALLPFVSVHQKHDEAALTPNGNVDLALQTLFLHAQPQDSVLLVSHLPLVCELVTELTNGQDRPMFAMAEIACVELDSHQKGTLLWKKQL